VLRRSSRVLLVGFAVFYVGVGNYTFGNSKALQYKERQREAVRLGGSEVAEPFRGTESILEERTEMHEYYEDSVTRYRYYKIMRRGGRFLMMIGGLLMVGAIVRRIAVPARSPHPPLP